MPEEELEKLKKEQLKESEKRLIQFMDTLTQSITFHMVVALVNRVFNKSEISQIIGSLNYKFMSDHNMYIETIDIPDDYYQLMKDHGMDYKEYNRKTGEIIEQFFVEVRKEFGVDSVS